jgi:hypothetical protein
LINITYHSSKWEVFPTTPHMFSYQHIEHFIYVLQFCPWASPLWLSPWIHLGLTQTLLMSSPWTNVAVTFTSWSIWTYHKVTTIKWYIIWVSFSLNIFL